MTDFYHASLSGEVSACANPGSCTVAPIASHFFDVEEAKAEALLYKASTVTAPDVKLAPMVSSLDHSKAIHIAPAAAGPGSKNRLETYHTGQSVGHINASTGDGDVNGAWGKGGVVILARPDGARVRVLAGGGERFTDPEKMLGQPVTHSKINGGSANKTENLCVIGYIDEHNNRYGWVPDKKMHYFIFR